MVLRSWTGMCTKLSLKWGHLFNLDTVYGPSQLDRDVRITIPEMRAPLYNSQSLISPSTLPYIGLAVCLQLVLGLPDDNYSHYRPIWQGLCPSTLRTTSANKCNSNSLLTPSYYPLNGLFSHIRSISGHRGPICMPPLLGNARHAPCPKKWMDSFYQTNVAMTCCV